MKSDRLPKSSETSTFSYRAEVDGLRAIAILVVVGFHAFPMLVPSGFVGVDIFFVISGYLISKLILVEIEKGHFRFGNFYLRRIRRIFPALILVLFAVYGFGWLSLFADEFRVLGEHVFAGTSFIINIILMRQIGYFDSAAHAKPLLHLWSLAVEEQFYVVWPLLLWSAARIRLSAFWPIALLCVASFAINISFLGNESAFFSPFTRFWELMLGSFLAFLTLNEPAYFAESIRSRGLRLSQNVNVDVRNLSAWLGVVLIATAVRFASVTEFPGWWALLPTLGTCLLIFAGPDAWLNRVVFSNFILVWVGLISYPLYLWHWPILSFIFIVRGNPGPVAVRIVAVVAAVALAALTYRFIEKPIRFGAYLKVKSAALAALLFFIGCAGAATYALQGFPSRYAAQANLNAANDLTVPISSRLSDSSCPKLFDIVPDQNEICLGNAPDPKFLILGDSTAMALDTAVYTGDIGLKTGLVAAHAHIWGSPDCMRNGIFDEWLQTKNTCADIVNHALKIAQERKTIDAIVISFALRDQFTYEADKLLGIQDAFLGLNKKIIYVLAPPLFNIEPSSCISRATAFGIFAPSSGLCVQGRGALESERVEYRDYFNKLKQTNPQVFIYDSMNALCGNHSCSMSDDSGTLYFIDGHVNWRGSARLLSGFLTWSKSFGGQLDR